MPYVGTEAMRFAPRTVLIGHSMIIIRQATAGLIPSMVAIEKAIYGFVPWDNNAFEVELRHKRRLYLVAQDKENGQVLGFAGLSINDYEADSHVTNIGVLPSFQRQGLGSKLFDILMMVSRKCGMKTMSLEVRRSNIEAQSLYERLGFMKTRLRRHYYVDNGEDAYEMSLVLGGEQENHDGRQINSGI